MSQKYFLIDIFNVAKYFAITQAYCHVNKIFKYFVMLFWPL